MPRNHCMQRTPSSKLCELVRRLEEYEPRTIISKEVRDYIEALLPNSQLRSDVVNAATARTALLRLAVTAPALARRIEPLLGATYSPTVVRCNSQSTNVIPTEASVDVDCRLLPCQDPDEAREDLARALAGIADWDFEWLECEVSGESAVCSPLRDAIERVISRMSSNGRVVSLYSTAGTDCPWFRKALPSVVAYGFCPSFDQDAPCGAGSMHTSNERVSVDDLGLQALFFEHAALELLR